MHSTLRISAKPLGHSHVVLTRDLVLFCLGSLRMRATSRGIAIVEDRWITLAAYRVRGSAIELSRPEGRWADSDHLKAWLAPSCILERIELSPTRLSLVAGKRARHWATLPSEMALLQQWFDVPVCRALALDTRPPRFYLVDQTLVICVDGKRWVCDAHGCQLMEPPEYWPTPLQYRHALRGALHSARLGKGQLAICRNALLIVDQQRHADTYECPGLWQRFDRALW